MKRHRYYRRRLVFKIVGEEIPVCWQSEAGRQIVVLQVVGIEIGRELFYDRTYTPLLHLLVVVNVHLADAETFSLRSAHAQIPVGFVLWQRDVEQVGIYCVCVVNREDCVRIGECIVGGCHDRIAL